MIRIISVIVLIAFVSGISAQNASEIIKKSQNVIKSKSDYTEIDMTIVRPKWKRKVSFKTCNKGTENSLVLIVNPTKEQGKTFLKKENKLWSWSPKISLLVKIPSSLLAQGWMGSDFSTDNLLSETSIINDYNHEIKGSATVSGRGCYKIILTPKANKELPWGKIIKLISKKDFLQLKTEYFDEDDYLVKTEISSNIKKMDGRIMPTHFEIIPAEDEGHKTIIDIKKVIFDVKIPPNFFTKENMKKGINIKFPTK